MAVAWCINAYDCSWCLIRTLEQLQSSNIGVWVQYTAPNPLDDKKIDYIKYTDKCWNTCCLTWENEILIYATNWVIKNLTLTNDDVNEAVVVKWNDIFWSNRAKTVVRYKTGSAPVSPTDWTLAVEETTKNQYSTNWFSVTGLSDSTTYYFSVFALDIDGTMIDVQNNTITTDFVFAWYQKVEYIQSSWTQYFKLWNQFKTSYKSVIDFQMDTIWWDYIPLWMRNTNWTRYWLDVWNWYFTIISWWNDWTNTKREDKIRHTITINKNTATVDWTNYWILYSDYTFNFWIWVFCYSKDWTTFANIPYMKMYKLEIYNENWVLIYDLYPVYRKSDNVIWMLDIVNKVFYTNQWSWSFTKWPNI